MQRVLDQRRKMIEDGAGLDWAMAEHLAFGTLLTKASRSGCPGRTCSAAPSRSAMRSPLVDQVTEKRYTPLNHLKKDWR
ncbi:MAG: hypothetical protein U1E15_00325 [Hyphomicrobiales bacterium]